MRRVVHVDPYTAVARYPITSEKAVGYMLRRWKEIAMFASKCRDLSRQGMPKIPCILLLHVLEQFLISGRGEFGQGGTTTSKMNVVRMDINEDHAAMFSYPVDLSFPQVYG